MVMTMSKMLCKAKSLDNGKWVQGYFATAAWYEDDSKVNVIIPIDAVLYPRCEINMCEVDARMLCRYTGINDRNGAPIFENDTVVYEAEEDGQRCSDIATVRYSEKAGRWFIDWNEYVASWLNIDDGKELRVIGNTYDISEQEETYGTERHSRTDAE